MHLGSTIATMAYDGTNRRISKAITNSADLNGTCHYYFRGWSIVETRNGSDQLLKQQIWGTPSGGYIDELCQIRVYDARPHDFYVLQDANYNAMGLVNHYGSLVERYEYTPYGERTVFRHARSYLNADFNDDGIVDSNDLTILAAHWQQSVSSYTQGDANNDGFVDVSDIGILAGERDVYYLPSATNDPDVTWPTLTSGSFNCSGSASYPGGFICEFGHQGLMHDQEIPTSAAGTIIQNRNRPYRPDWARFPVRDMLNQNLPGGGYHDGMNLYGYTMSNPNSYLDSTGSYTLADARASLVKRLIPGGKQLQLGSDVLESV